jgi:hypothetical protein
VAQSTFLRDCAPSTRALAKAAGCRRLRLELIYLQSYPPKGTGGTISQATLVMLRDDWWWPWWVSTLIDLAIVAIALAVFFLTRRRALRIIAAAVVLAGLVAAIMAPIVMTDDSDGRMNRMEPDNTPMTTP